MLTLAFKLIPFVKLLVLITAVIGLYSCKKNQNNDLNPDAPLSIGTRTEFTLDSIFLYAKEIYYWRDALPSYAIFSPRSRYADYSPKSAFRQELFDITQYPLNPTGVPYEYPMSGKNPRYSYLQEFTPNYSSNASASVNEPRADIVYNSRILNDKTAYLYLRKFDLIDYMMAGLGEVFDQFAAAKTEILIIDLRDNSGGYIESVAYLANLIVPSALQGKIMYSEQYNEFLRSGNANLLKHQPFYDNNGQFVVHEGDILTLADLDFSSAANMTFFDKKGGLETIKQVYFIVSSHTASASELLISCLKPYLPVRLVGQQTYGKPVGFFPIYIDRYEIYLASFLLSNANGWSDYFDGMVPDVHIAGSSSYVLGDPREFYLAATLRDIFTNTQGASVIRKSKSKTAKQAVSAPTDRLENQMDYIPMVKERYKFKVNSKIHYRFPGGR